MTDQWYAVHRTNTGELVSVGTVLGQLAAGLASVALAGQPNFKTQRWNPATLAIEPIPAPTDDDLAAAIAPRPQLDPTAAVGKAVLRDLTIEAAQAWIALDALTTRTAGDAGATQAQKDATAALATGAYQRARRLAAKWAATS